VGLPEAEVSAGGWFETMRNGEEEELMTKKTF
jgi:hypothetical protein